MTSVVHSCEDVIDYKKVRRIWRTADFTKVSTASPSGNVKANQIYVYRVNVDTSSNYWRFDGFQWRNLRSHVHPEKDPWCRRITFQLIVKGEPQNFYRREYYPYGSTVNPPNSWITPFVLVQYYGSFDINAAATTVHGNKKDTPSKAPSQIIQELLGGTSPQKLIQQDYPVLPKKISQVAKKRTGGYYKKAKRNRLDPNEVALSPKRVLVPEVAACSTSATSPEKAKLSQTMSESTIKTKSAKDASTKNVHPFQRKHPSVKLNLTKKLLEKASPSQAYREVVRDVVMSGDSSNNAMSPRNLKQVYNIQHQLKNANQHDDLYETYLFARQHPDIVVNLQLIPQLVMTVMHPDVNLHVESLQKYYTPSVFHYDTTFDIGTYYTSILSMRNPLFKTEPLIPVAVMFHETTSESCHDVFFETIKFKFQANNQSTIIITDREKTIKNSLRAKLPEVKNIFCWNHLKKNVESWVKDHVSPNEVFYYKDQVIKLLKAENEQEYDLLYAKTSAEWSNEFQDYYTKFLEKDLKTSYRPVLEEFGIYSEESGITYNPAESTNAFLKRNMLVKNSSLFQTLSVWYFFQVDIMMEICRGREGNGNFVLAGKAPDHIFFPKNMADLLPRPVISSLVYEGKLPENMVTSAPYKTKSIIEATTLRGLANFFIKNDRVTLLPKNGSFIVNGLRGKTYLVDLKTGSCSCLRPRTCEHRFAAMKSAGVEGKITTRRCQPSLGKLYKRTARRATGKKRGQGFRLRITVPKKPRIIQCSPNKDDDQVPLVDPEVETVHSNLKSNGHSPLLSNKITNLPGISKQNLNLIALHLPVGNIWLKELKSVQPNLPKKELQMLAQTLEPNIPEALLTWLVDSVVSGFLFAISDLKNQGNISITATEAQCLISGKRARLLFSKEDGDGKEYHDWGKIKLVFIPYCYQQNHWVLIALKPMEKTIFVLDPIAKFQLPSIQRVAIENAFNPRFNFPRSTIWKVSYPTASVCKGESALECGPFICFFAEAIVRGWSLVEMPDSKQYRSHMLSVLVGNCHPFADKRLKKCYKCKEKISEWFQCNFCKLKRHKACSQKVVVRGREYFICN